MMFDDISMMVFYYLEVTPSLLVITVLWKSNNEVIANRIKKQLQIEK
jgi:hypothetical protein